MLAYIDPGSGSILLQVLIAGALGTIVVWWRRLKTFFIRKKPEPPPPSTPE